MNRPEVQEALHANVTRLTHDWEPCSNVIQKWVDSPSTIIPHLQELMANGLRVWIFRKKYYCHIFRCSILTQLGINLYFLLLLLSLINLDMFPIQYSYFFFLRHFTCIFNFVILYVHQNAVVLESEKIIKTDDDV